MPKDAPSWIIVGQVALCTGGVLGPVMIQTLVGADGCYDRLLVALLLSLSCYAAITWRMLSPKYSYCKKQNC